MGYKRWQGKEYRQEINISRKEYQQGNEHRQGFTVDIAGSGACACPAAGTDLE
jgi:hypothetical protein